MSDNPIGQRVKMLRQAAGLNQRALADKARLHFMDIMYLEMGRVKLPMAALSRIAYALNVTVDHLLTAPDESEPA